MAANTHMQEVLDMLASFGMPPIPSLSPENARELPTPADAVMGVVATHAGDRMKSFFTPSPEPVGGVTHKVIPGPGGDILMRVYMPKSGDAPYPVLVYFHGGGWVIAGLDAYDASCRALSNAAECVVCSVAYRKAPEHKYPAAVEDAGAAYQWVLSNASSLNGDPERVAVGGESAGGNLATVVCLMARDKGMRPPVFQLLVYPVCDYAFDTPSYQEHASAKPLDKPMMEWFYKNYLKNPAQGAEPYASPLRAPDLSGLPPAMVITDEIDPLRSEGEAYARRMQDAGVLVMYRNFDGVTHEFFGMKAVLPEAKEAIDAASDALRAGFSGEMRRSDWASHPNHGMAASDTMATGAPMTGNSRERRASQRDAQQRERMDTSTGAEAEGLAWAPPNEQTGEATERPME